MTLVTDFIARSVNRPVSYTAIFRKLRSKPQIYTFRKWKSINKPMYCVSKIRESSDD